MSDELVAFLNARLDEDEAAAKNRTCINCGGRTAPLRNAFGITGHTHDSWDPETETRRGWEGRRCPNRPTAAEPVQDPARALREVAAKRALLLRHEEDRHVSGQCSNCFGALGEHLAWPCPTIRIVAAVYSDHPDYRQSWPA